LDREWRPNSQPCHADFVHRIIGIEVVMKSPERDEKYANNQFAIEEVNPVLGSPGALEESHLPTGKKII
jgi:hypothetical protein